MARKYSATPFSENLSIQYPQTSDRQALNPPDSRRRVVEAFPMAREL